MRILYLTGHYPPDLTSGATLQVQRLALAALRAGHDVLVVAGSHRSGLADGATHDETVDGVDVRWIGNSGWTDQHLDANWWNPVAAAATAEVLDSWRPDVVHAHALQTLGADSLLAAVSRCVRTVVTMHDFWWVCPRLFLVDRDLQPCSLVPRLGTCDCARSAGWRRDREERLREVLARVDVVLAPSQSMCDVLAANGIRALVDPNDLDLDTPALHTVAPSGDTSGDTSCDTSGTDPRPDVRFLYIGGPNPLKGADVVGAAAARLQGVDGWRLVAHGVDGFDGSGEQRVGEQRVREQRVGEQRVREPRVVTAPPFDPRERTHVLADADVLVLPSIARESFSLAAREALHAGLAVISSDCLGPQEVVRHEVNGLIVATGDAEALAEAMRRLVDDRELLDRLQLGARRTHLDQRDADEHLAALLPHYMTTRRAVVSAPTAVVVSRPDGSPSTSAEVNRVLAELRHEGWLADAVEIAGTGIASSGIDAPVDAPVDAPAVPDRDLTVLVGDVESDARVTVRARPLPYVRIVVVNHENRQLTLRCLAHLDALTYPRDRREVVIVDNASGDGLVDHLRATRPDVTVIASNVNGGFGAGCNLGIAHPGHWDAIALVNNDSVPEPDWLDALVATWRRPPVTDGPIGAVAGKVLLAGTHAAGTHAAGTPGPLLVNSVGCRLLDDGFNADRGDGSPDDGTFDEVREVFGWSGASVLLSRVLLDDIGVFEESFFLYYEDVDMVWRGRRRGWSVVCAPAAVSVHDRGSSAGRGEMFAFHDTRNRLFVLARHAPLSWLAHALAVQVRSVVMGDGEPSRALRSRVLVSFARHVPRLVRQRRDLARRATLDVEHVVAWRDR